MRFLAIFLVLGCVSVIYAQLPPDCAAALCPQLECMDPITPRGRCCPICPGNKSGTCPRVLRGMFGICVEECRNDYECPGRQKCCSNGCGHVCKRPESGGRPDCFLVDCPQLICISQYTPPGSCCPVCRPSGKIDCVLFGCAPPTGY